MIQQALGILAFFAPPPVNKLIHRIRGVKMKDASTTWIGFGTTIDNLLPKNVEIGEHVTISTFVKIYTHFEPPQTIQDRYMAYYEKPVVIGDNVFIGTGTIILPGVTIGSWCVIGAGSVVTKDLPDYSVCAGNPARVIRDIREDCI